MKKWVKVLLGLVMFGSLCAAGVFYYVFVYSVNHKRNVADEKGIEITAKDLTQSYLKEAKKSDSLYLNKTLEISGEIKEIKTDSVTTITLKGLDSTSSVFCTLKQKDSSIKEGSIISVKGVCTGSLEDLLSGGINVVLNEALLIKK